MGLADDRFGTLMRAAQDGDAASYRQLLTELAPLLRRAVAAKSRFFQPSDVEDIVQETLLSLHAVRHTYDPKRPFRPWIMAILHNRVADAARRQGRRASNEVLMADPPETFFDAATNTGGGSVGDPEALARAIGELPAGQRRAVELLKLRELSLKEASVTSGMKIGALKVAVHRGIAALRKALKKEV